MPGAIMWWLIPPWEAVGGRSSGSPAALHTLSTCSRYAPAVQPLVTLDRSGRRFPPLLCRLRTYLGRCSRQVHHFAASRIVLGDNIGDSAKDIREVRPRKRHSLHAGEIKRAVRPHQKQSWL